MPGLQDKLADGLAGLGLVLDAACQAKLLHYLDLLQHWNRVHNLTAVREPAAMVARHLLDCLAVLPNVQGERLLDIGAGAGLPGLVLAIARPELHCTLVDARAKKVAFLNVAIAELGLSNARALHTRVEDLPHTEDFDLATARAVGDLALLWRLARPHLGHQGRLLALCAQVEPEGLERLRAQGLAVQAHRLRVPGLTAERHLVLVTGSLSLHGPTSGKPAA